MQKRFLTPELQVSALGLGCMGMSEFYGDTNDAESLKVLEEAYSAGITFYDTADMYGPHTNEILLGQFIAGKRPNITLATKFGIVRDADARVRSINGKPEYVKQAAEASLKRLNTDYIDLYYLHRVDPETPIEDTVGAMAELVKAGQVRFLGLSEVSGATLRRAHAVHPISAVQSEYSLWTRDPEDDVLAVCKELGIGFVPYSPLGRGFLTGAIQSPDDFADNDYRRFSPRFQGENFNKNLELVKAVEQFAADKGFTPSQIALAWVLAQGDNLVPIPGTKRSKYLQENLGALNVHLSQQDLDTLNAIAPKNVASGTRYPEALMDSVNR